MNAIQRSFAALTLPLLFIACNKSSGGSSAGETASTPPPAALIGSWELVSQSTPDGRTVTHSGSSGKKVQLIFTDKDWRYIESDEITIRVQSKFAYTFENSEIKSTPADGIKPMSFGFISAGPEELKLRVTTVVPADQFLYWNLKRIQPLQLAPNSLKALQQTLQWTLTLPDGTAPTFAGRASNPIDWANGASINCSYQSATSREGKTTRMLFVSYMVYIKSGASTLTAPQSPYFRAVLPMTLNIERENETFKLEQLSGGAAVMGYVGNSDQQGFSSALNERCGIKGERKKHQLTIELVCENVGTVDSAKRAVFGKLSAKATCSLL